MNASTQHLPLTGRKLLLGSLAVSLAMFMNVLDSSIANVAIPTISGELGVSVDEGTWVITIFAASNAVSIPLTGWLTQRFGQVRLFVGSILLFTLASWMCGVAPNLPALLGARILQGAVAGPLAPLSQALMLGAWPRQKSSTALAIWSMTGLLGPIAGPAIGGWMTYAYHWSWIFYVNVPFGIFTAGLAWVVFRDRESQRHRLPIDVVGLLLLIIWVAALQVMLDKGKDLDWFHSPLIVWLGMIAAVFFAVFLIWELTDEHPIVDLRLFSRRNFAGGTIAMSIAYGIYFATLVLMPQWMQEYLGYRAVDSGLAIAPLGIFAVILTPVMGRVLPHVDSRRVATLAFVGFAAVFFMRTRFYTDVSTWDLVLPSLLQGIPMAMFFVPLTSIILSGLPPEKIPAAAGLSNFFRTFCIAISTATISDVWNNRTILHHVRLMEVASVTNPVFNQSIDTMTQAMNIDRRSAYALFNSTVDGQATIMGLNDVFMISAAIFIAIIPLIWITKPVRGNAPVDAAGAH